jgi:hypothetical protein
MPHTVVASAAGLASLALLAAIIGAVEQSGSGLGVRPRGGRKGISRIERARGKIVTMYGIDDEFFFPRTGHGVGVRTSYRRLAVEGRLKISRAAQRTYRVELISADPWRGETHTIAEPTYQDLLALGVPEKP